MRLAVIYLAVVVGVVAIVAFVGIGVGLIMSPAEIVRKANVERVVFVDLDKIVVAHPVWGALQSMKSTTAEAAGAGRRLQTNPSAPAFGPMVLPALSARVATPRWMLEDRAARRADDALTQLRTERMDALAARLRATKKTMIDSAESDLALKMYDAEQEAAGKVNTIGSARGYEQINLRAKISALEAMLGKRGLKNVGVTLGVNEEDARKRLAETRAELEKIDHSIAAETKKVADATADAVGALRAASRAKIDSAIAAYGAQETRTVEEHIKQARNQVMGDVMSLSEIAGYDVGVSPKAGGMREVAGKVRRLALGARPAYGVRREAIDWRAREAALEKRLREDTAAMVRKMARERGMRVVFARQSGQVPDETARFIKIMSEQGWRLGEPVLYGPSDS